MRDDVRPVIFILVFRKSVLEPLGKASSTAYFFSPHMVHILAFYAAENLNSGPYFTFYSSPVEVFVWVAVPWAIRCWMADAPI